MKGSALSKSELIRKLEETRVAIKRLKQKNKELNQALDSFPLQLWIILMDVLQDPKQFHYPDISRLKVIDPIYKDHLEVEFKGSDIICVVAEPKSRRKYIYLNRPDKNLKSKIKLYILNNNEFNFQKLALHLDKLSHRLVQISKSAIVNVEYYEKGKGNLLMLCEELPDSKNISQFKTSSPWLKNFNVVRENYLRTGNSLQKRLSDYNLKNHIPD